MFTLIHHFILHILLSLFGHRVGLLGFFVSGQTFVEMFLPIDDAAIEYAWVFSSVLDLADGQSFVRSSLLAAMRLGHGIEDVLVSLCWL